MPRLWTVPKEAMAALEQAARERFQKQMCARMAKEFPEKAGELPSAVERGIAAAVEHGITAEPDIERFLHFWFQSDFDPDAKWPWAQATLTNPAADGSAKVELMARLIG
jgi:hypothetical protein